MKHATTETIAKLEPLLNRIRKFRELKEKKPGIYYYKFNAFLHFHEDGNQVYADIKLIPPNFERFPASTSEQQDQLISLIQRKIG